MKQISDQHFKRCEEITGSVCVALQVEPVEFNRENNHVTSWRIFL
ncbi:hypothetical protein ACF08B_41055 [Streptomyces sp. NPDC015139]